MQLKFGAVYFLTLLCETISHRTCPFSGRMLVIKQGNTKNVEHIIRYAQLIIGLPRILRYTGPYRVNSGTGLCDSPVMKILSLNIAESFSAETREVIIAMMLFQIWTGSEERGRIQMTGIVIMSTKQPGCKIQKTINYKRNETKLDFKHSILPSTLSTFCTFYTVCY
jgi:hypothetical protein